MVRLAQSQGHSCYFRTTVQSPRRKALVQITERCNLHCAHCFVSAGDYGDAMSFESIRDILVPQLIAANVERVTLTGGEPTIHPQILEIVDCLVKVGLDVGICTNGLRSETDFLTRLKSLERVHINVSLDGFSAKSHGKFRGNSDSFVETIKGIRRFAEAGLLQGLLVTPNNLASIKEYVDLHSFANEVGAEYVLMNPLSPFGRGAVSEEVLAAADERMDDIREATEGFEGTLDLVRVRFPGSQVPPSGCEAGTIFYVFQGGDVAVCPYLVFAAESPLSQHDRQEFIACNVFRDDLARALDDYPYKKRLEMGQNETCQGCSVKSSCGKGCPAAVVAAGERIGALDVKMCPEVP